MKGSQMNQDATEPNAQKQKVTEPLPVATTPVATAKPDADPPAMSERDEAAIKLVDRFSLWSGAAALIPVPVLDLAAVGGLQLRMLRRLAEIYDVPYSENRGKSIIASFAGTLIPAGAAPATASVLKSFPGIGTAIAALTMPTFSAGATYMIGRAFIQHFASGGTLLDFAPPDYRKFARTLRDDFSLRSQPRASVESEKTTATGPRAAST
jgi:uncharacterized protein (DUF697 family)